MEDASAEAGACHGNVSVSAGGRADLGALEDGIAAEPNEGGGTIFTDLCVDVVVYPDGEMQVWDLGEAGDVFARGDMPAELLADALKKTDRLLRILYRGSFGKLQKVLTDAEKGVFPSADATLASILSDGESH